VAGNGFEAHASVAPTGDPVMVRVTGPVLVVTVRPELSWTATAGWVAEAVPPVAFDGELVKASWAAGPATVNVVLTALASGAEVAVSV
jgi:hypothetical protein